MYQYKNKSKKIIKIVIVILLVLVGILLINLVIHVNRDNKKHTMVSLIERDIDSVMESLKENKLDIDIKYEFNDKISKNRVISQSIPYKQKIKENDKLILVVSLGKLDKDKMAEDKINELGKVPVMMYHGIKNVPKEELKYVGGNIDRDGYARTSEAFRNDLELYYKLGYRMIKISDYIDGKIDVPYGKSPIVLTFDDGNANNIKVTGLDESGNIIIDNDSAVGILEEFKKKYPDYNVTASFYITNNLFNQPEYNEKIIKWLIENGYEVGNHTKGHNNLTKIDETETEEVIGYMYDKLDTIIGDKYLKVVALPFGSPYKKEHPNYSHVIKGTYNEKEYQTKGALRVGWEPDLSPFNKEFDPTFIKRCRAYDDNGKEFDIDMVFNQILNKRRYISDGNINTIVTSKSNEELIDKNTDKEVIIY